MADAANQQIRSIDDCAKADTATAEGLLQFALAGDLEAFKLAVDRWVASSCSAETGSQQASGLGSIRDSHGAGLVHYAARFGAPELLNYLVTVCGLSATEAAVEFGDTPAHNAAAAGQVACLNWLLLEAGADPLARDAEGLNPLHVAAYSGHAAAVEWLLEWTACSAVDRSASGATPAEFCQPEDKEVLGLLLRLSKGGFSTDGHEAQTECNVQTSQTISPMSRSIYSIPEVPASPPPPPKQLQVSSAGTHPPPAPPPPAPIVFPSAIRKRALIDRPAASAISPAPQAPPPPAPPIPQMLMRTTAAAAAAPRPPQLTQTDVKAAAAPTTPPPPPPAAPPPPPPPSVVPLRFKKSSVRRPASCGALAEAAKSAVKQQKRQQGDLIAELKRFNSANLRRLQLVDGRDNDSRNAPQRPNDSDITAKLSADKDVKKSQQKPLKDEQLPDAEAQLPRWLREHRARQEAQRAARAAEEAALQQAEEARLAALPPWKRQLRQRILT